MHKFLILLILTCCTLLNSTPPIVRITTPEDGGTVGGVVEVRISVIHEKKIEHVELSINHKTIAILKEVPYIFMWNAPLEKSVPQHMLQAQAIDINGEIGVSPSITVIIQGVREQPGFLWLKSGMLNNEELDINNPLIYVSRGDSIAGEIMLQAINQGNPDWGAPLTGTPSWGEHERMYWDSDIWLPPDTSLHTLSIDITAPVDTGLGYIVYVWGHESDPANVLSLTYWRFPGGPVWNDGVDVADWSDEQIQMAIDSGCVASQYLYADSTYGLMRVPAAALRIYVRDDN